jgi:hypothetical protein
MASVVPDARLIFLVRDPAARAISNYAHQRTLGRDRRAIEEALGDPRSPYVARSRYALAIEPFLRSFDRSQLLILSREELLERRRETVRAAYRFVGVDESFWSEKAVSERYRGEAKAARGPVARMIARSPARVLARRMPDASSRGRSGRSPCGGLRSRRLPATRCARGSPRFSATTSAASKTSSVAGFRSGRRAAEPTL